MGWVPRLVARQLTDFWPLLLESWLKRSRSCWRSLAACSIPAGVNWSSMCFQYSSDPLANLILESSNLRAQWAPNCGHGLTFTACSVRSRPIARHRHCRFQQHTAIDHRHSSVALSLARPSAGRRAGRAAKHRLRCAYHLQRHLEHFGCHPKAEHSAVVTSFALAGPIPSWDTQGRTASFHCTSAWPALPVADWSPSTRLFRCRWHTNAYSATTSSYLSY